MARRMESTRVSRQPSASCLSISGSIRSCSRTTPSPRARKKAASGSADWQASIPPPHGAAEEGGLRFGVLAAPDLPPQAMRLEFGDHGVEVDPRHVHLIQGLD